MACEVTILVVPRDRFSSVVPCVKSIVEHTDLPYRLVILDFGYSRKTLVEIRRACGSQAVRSSQWAEQFPCWRSSDTCRKLNQVFGLGGQRYLCHAELAERRITAGTCSVRESFCQSHSNEKD